MKIEIDWRGQAKAPGFKQTSMRRLFAIEHSRIVELDAVNVGGRIAFKKTRGSGASLRPLKDDTFPLGVFTKRSDASAIIHPGKREKKWRVDYDNNIAPVFVSQKGILFSEDGRVLWGRSGEDLYATKAKARAALRAKYEKQADQLASSLKSVRRKIRALK